jgi:poly(3-hydroxyalkanoate) synthetase
LSYRQIFKENRLARVNSSASAASSISTISTVPSICWRRADDDITTPEQVLDAAKYIGTAKDRIVQKTVPGGHIGLFMGANTLRDHWPQIARWIGTQ